MKKTLLALALVAAAPLAAHATDANGIGYTYVQLDYVNQTGSGHQAVSDGGALSGSYQFENNFHAFGSYAQLGLDKDYANGMLGDTDGTHISGKEKPWSLGLGYQAAIGNRADWVTEASYTHNRYSARFCYDDYGCEREHATSNGWALSTGVMGRVTDNLTANAYLGYSNGGRFVMGNVYGDFGLVYSFDKTWALHGGLRVNNDGTENVSVGVRASF